MSACCGGNQNFDGATTAYRRALWAVIAINGSMFVVEVLAGAMAHSMALQADALDFLADTATYALSLFVIGRSTRLRASAALLKGLSLAAMGVGVLGWTIYRMFVLGTPSATVMSGIGLLALAANAVSVLLLLRYRNGDANVRSVWLCSRNDMIGNVAVIAAAGGVFLTGTAWPDLLVAAAMAALFLSSAISIIRQALGEWRQTHAEHVGPVPSPDRSVP